MPRSKLIVASSEASADMLYATGFRAPDAFVFLQTGNRRLLLLSDLEFDRGRQQAKVDRVDSFSEIEEKARDGKKKKPAYARVIAAWLRANKTRGVVVPADFPLGLSRLLKKEGVRLKPAKGSFFPEREKKSLREIHAIEAAIRIAEAGMARAIDVLKSAVPRKDGCLVLGRRILTSEILRAEIETTIVRAGGEARGDTIVAGGNQACDPHERGTGPLRANELIVLDIFPRDARSGYYGDITRTVVRGKATDDRRKLWETCLTGQAMALEKMKPGNQGAAIHDSIKEYFADQGYPTEIREGRWQGFFHGTGHGLGLEVHEAPRFAAATFLPGQVITIEPGIYIPGIGGVRHEDVALITRRGPRLLTKAPKPLEI
ncbi:MAG: Xaa-Pro peptidase family protein [Terrimicrobiaceae bacterium]|nr:Xaa-Pro peptidase family protein [Terrimicrobiaceae bacterium]